MAAKRKFTRLMTGAALLAALEFVCVAAINLALTAPAHAQFFDDRYPSRQRPRSGGGGFFGNLFGPFESGPRYYEPKQQQHPAQADYSRAPAPKKSETTPNTTVAVIGDAMADWLAYGLESTFADEPDIGIVRKNKARSGLIRYEPRSDLDWPHVVRDFLTKENVNYIVVMLGVSDRQSIRESDVEREAEQKNAESKDNADQNGTDQKKADDNETPNSAAPEIARKPAKGVIEFRSDRWEKIYTKRIDDMIAALKSKGVPVFWVGLPSIRGTKSTADTVYLNDLYRARAERAGVKYIDVWDGFVDDAGKFTMHGPDYEGQTRRLRAYDGVYFTTYGAIKLAHYVDRDLQRAIANRAIPVSLPSGGPVVPQAPNVRPLAGPVVPLTVTGNSDELLGGAGNRANNADPTAARVLVKGEPVPAPPGRADDFTWPRGSDAKVNAAPVAAAPAVPAKSATAKVEPMAPAVPAARSKKNLHETKAAQAAQAKAKRPAQEVKPKQPLHRSNVPRPPAPIGGGGLFGIFR